MEYRKRSEYFRRMAEDLIKREPELAYIKDSMVIIAYLESNKKKIENGKVVLGQCEKVMSKNQWAMQFDFTITIFAPNVEGLTEEQLKMVMFHELLHIGIEQEDESDRYYIVPHDLEDFKLIIDKFGTDYALPAKG